MRKRKSEELFPDHQVILELISYNEDHHDKFDETSVDDLLPKFKKDRVNWINLDGLSNTSIIEKLQAHFSLHSLVIEDILNDQRPKSEEYEDYLYFTLKMLYSIEGDKIEYEQISFVLCTNYLISFQEKAGDLFDPFRERIRLDQGRVRKKKADYLLYRLIDIIVDHYYVVLDKIGDQIEEIEESIHSNTSGNAFQKIQSIKKELIFLRKAVYPLREALSKLVKGESSFILEENLRYYSDVYDHSVHLIDSLDTYKDLTASLMDIHINTMNTKMNEVMKLLTVITTIFIPLSFIAGIYGMNFDVMPELRWQYGYPAVLVSMGVVSIGMLYFFKRRKWF
ncbi:MAG TPA: magnesium/cobalt transporter CorA [Cyclobacteriaceae bacterium]|nr:magnesium/cobalt transporter CorA [Cyclobacteriaceae bacterium]